MHPLSIQSISAKIISISSFALFLGACVEDVAVPVDHEAIVNAYQALEIQTRVTYNNEPTEQDCGSKVGNGLLFQAKTINCPDGGQLIGEEYGMAGKFEYSQCALNVDDNLTITVTGSSKHDLYGIGFQGTITNLFEIELIDPSSGDSLGKLEMIEQTLQSNCHLQPTRADQTSFISVKCIDSPACDSTWHTYSAIDTEYNEYSNWKEFIYSYEGETLDADHDGILNNADNCLTTPNSDQLDENANQIGDACE